MVSGTSRDTASDWRLFVIEYARSHNQPVASLLMGAYDEGVMDLPFAFVLAQRGDFNVLIDTGFMNEGGGAEMAKKFSIPKWISPVRMLEELGVRAESVNHIVLSHAHYDHMGSIDQFPKAHIYMQKEELMTWIEALALPPRFDVLTCALDPDDIHTAISAAAEHRLTLLDGDADDVLPGIHVRTAAGGHTMGQQFVCVDTARGRMVVTGDCIYSRRNLTGLAGDGVYVPLGFGIGSSWAQLKSYERIRRESGDDLDKLVILHDFDRWKNFEKVKSVEGFMIFQAG
jgi:glyoxylase-like metal-dependent hydrolase (beta-lactamase superfamily II)